MKVLVSGATGLIGAALGHALKDQGHQVVPLTRNPDGVDGPAVGWDPARSELDPSALEGFDAVVHLAGESIASGRWTEARKKRIRDSRVKGTALLADTLARLEKKPEVMVSASAIGLYGDRGDEKLDERSDPGSGFLAEVCIDWEAAAEPARRAGIRVVHPRFGLVLSAEGGALAKMLPAFKLGMGGKIGDGEQYMPWVTLPDVVGALGWAITRKDLTGPMNVTAPEPVKNAEFTKILGRVLGRPTLLPVPGFAARLALGEMGDQLLLSSARVLPVVATEQGYPFQHTELEAGLRAVLS